MQPQILPEGELQDGFAAQVFFSLDPDISMGMTQMKPPGLSGNGAIPQSTFKNVAFVTKLPGALIDVQDITFEARVSPAELVALTAIFLTNGQIFWKWPNGRWGKAWGWIEKLDPPSMQSGTKPLMSGTLIISNLNDDGEEEGIELDLATDPRGP